MGSPENALSFPLGIGSARDRNRDVMSPITSLARNLSILSTELPATPCRRISWSNPTPNREKPLAGEISDSPLCMDSPMFQEGVLRDIGGNARSNRGKKLRPCHKNLKGTVDNDKENIHQTDIRKYLTMSSKNQSAKICNSPVKHDSQDCECNVASQDSGYSGSAFEKTAPCITSSVPRVRSTIFTDEETEDDDGFFPVENFIDAKESNVSVGMSELFTNPLRNCTDGRLVSKDSQSEREVFFLRRCFSMSSGDFSHSIATGRKKAEVHVMECSNVSRGEEASKKLLMEVDDPHGIVAKSAFKRPDLHDSMFTPLQSKRRKSSNVTVPQAAGAKNDVVQKMIVQHSYAEAAAKKIMQAVQESDQHPDLIGDCSKPYVLPLISGRHQDLKSIAPATLSELLSGQYGSSVKNYAIIDCRYPYEYEGGHIRGAKNIFTKEALCQALLSGTQAPQDDDAGQHSIIIFHCEFSSERAPKLLRFLRNKDRELNQQSYPQLCHPEIYILDGGYKAFFEMCKHYCEPETYKPMLHKDHSGELREFRAKSKSWGGDSKTRSKARSNLKF